MNMNNFPQTVIACFCVTKVLCQYICNVTCNINKHGLNCWKIILQVFGFKTSYHTLYTWHVQYFSHFSAYFDIVKSIGCVAIAFQT